MLKANFFVVGGPISVGKTTLIESLNYPKVKELENENPLQDLLLHHTYNKERVNPEVIEYYFLELRKMKYEEFANSEELHVFDRSIFESLWFAKQNMSAISYSHFEKLWRHEVSDLIIKFGKPKLYILLTLTWDSFKKRIFERNRSFEVEYFEKNESFFVQHINEYESHLEAILQQFGISYMKLSTDNLTWHEVSKKTKDILKGIL